MATRWQRKKPVQRVERRTAHRKGRRELRELRQVIRYPRTGRYFSSDLSRCRETFQELYGPHIVLDGLRPEFREICFGSLENRPGTQEDFMHFSGLGWQGTPSLM